jgi:hypothetical protein
MTVTNPNQKTTPKTKDEDPLEAAKLTAAEATRRANESDKPALASEEPNLPPVIPGASVPRYQVTEDSRVYQGGRTILLRKGKILSAESHGPEVLTLLSQNGVKFIEL